jgi:hypothetical protein
MTYDKQAHKEDTAGEGINSRLIARTADWIVYGEPIGTIRDMLLSHGLSESDCYLVYVAGKTLAADRGVEEDNRDTDPMIEVDR